ncbi:MAG: hypothetical protein WKF92_06085 [Pyrinomonadaceae bacterium]
MLKSWKFAYLTIVFIAFATIASGQIKPVAVEEIVKNADIQRLSYVAEFRNLLSEETKTFEEFDKKGEPKKQRIVKSIFVIYQLSKDENQIAEYRNVVAVDGKPVEKTEQRAQDFFERIASIESTQKELQRIQDESSRFDGDMSIEGFTLFQSAPLAENLRPFFEFTLEGQETIDGLPTYRIAYKQIRDSPYILINSKKDGENGRLTLNYSADTRENENLNQRLKGKLWIDVETFQTRREIRTLSVKPKDFQTMTILAENSFEYQKSDFGILTPRKITYMEYRLNKNQPAAKQIRVTFDYEKFTKPNVDVNSSEVK